MGLKFGYKKFVSNSIVILVMKAFAFCNLSIVVVLVGLAFVNGSHREGTYYNSYFLP